MKNEKLKFPDYKKEDVWPNFRYYTKVKLKQVTNINIKCKTLMVLETNIGEHRCELGLGEEFLDMRPKHNPQEKKS